MRKSQERARAGLRVPWAWCDVPCALRAWMFTGLHPVRAVGQATIDKELDTLAQIMSLPHASQHELHLVRLHGPIDATLQ